MSVGYIIIKILLIVMGIITVIFSGISIHKFYNGKLDKLENATITSISLAIGIFAIVFGIIV